MKVIIIGAGGAIGSCLSGWLSEVSQDIYLFDKPSVSEVLKEKGITYYKQNEAKQNVKVKVIDSLSEVENPDLIAIVVKNYSLDGVSGLIKETVKGNPVILGLQNGVENQRILPKYFDRVVYGIIEFNAWLDEIGIVGYQNRGPFVIGTLDNGMQAELKAIAELFNKGVETIITDRITDAAYCKMVINLTNSFTTLVGMGYRDITNLHAFKEILTNSMYEGVKILKKMGVKEYKAHTMPTWAKIKASATLPNFITDGMFKKNLAKMVLSSMAQDIIQRKSGESELESLIGEFVSLGDRYGMDIPYNRAVYKLCKEKFNRHPFVPMTEEEVLAEVRKLQNK
ncbi:MAG: 2-dehydropantoate 2-reductase [Clostridiales bacterium]|jgi:2-dehydropantoate 2-reductase|nr:2-dehydropantoate 2-reductase [Clostridiales bacterium]HOK82368.1 2-dehydropantoate 2-reductase [Clostridia bacterium]HOL61474.1 2-dehydropantoate 2-reductase [Clostridia bacterium]HPO54112.1 2-dehydropantoate 2-reductase [Clostridia bacterium]